MVNNRTYSSTALERFFSSPHRLKPALGPTQPPIQWVHGALSLGVKQPGHELSHSPPSSSKVKNSGAIPPLPNVFMAQCLIN
jgi:hypothetical protein